MKNLKMNPEDYARRLWDWTGLNECFDRGIRVGDVDGLVEVSGKFLLLEGKSLESRGVPEGQRIMFEALAKLPEFTIIVFRGKPPSIETVIGWKILGGEEFKKYISGRFFSGLKGCVKLWFEWADKNNK